MEIPEKELKEMEFLLLQCEDFFQEHKKDFEELEKKLKKIERECFFEH